MLLSLAFSASTTDSAYAEGTIALLLGDRLDVQLEFRCPWRRARAKDGAIEGVCLHVEGNAVGNDIRM